MKTDQDCPPCVNHGACNAAGKCIKAEIPVDPPIHTRTDAERGYINFNGDFTYTSTLPENQRNFGDVVHYRYARDLEMALRDAEQRLRSMGCDTETYRNLLHMDTL